MYKNKGKLKICYCSFCLSLWAILIAACSYQGSTIEYPGYSVSEWFEKTPVPYKSTNSKNFNYKDHLASWAKQGEIEEYNLFEAMFQHPDLVSLRVCKDHVVKYVMLTYVIKAESKSLLDATFIQVDISACGSRGRWKLVDSGHIIKSGEIINSYIKAYFSDITKGLNLPKGSILNDPPV